MKANAFVQRQQAALAEVQRLIRQLESGEIGEADGMARIESVMQALEAQTDGYQRQRRSAGGTSRLSWWLAAVVLLAVAVIAMLYMQHMA